MSLDEALRVVLFELQSRLALARLACDPEADVSGPLMLLKPNRI